MPTIADIPVGGKLKFGAYSVAGEKPHKICWVKVNSDNTLFSEFIEDQLAFDAVEPDSPNGRHRVEGNSRYSLSNLHQFLNSNETSWFHKAHEYDAPPVEGTMMHKHRDYWNRPGFLSEFKQWEIDTIDESEIVTRLPDTDDEEYENIAAKLFIPSKSNAGIYESGEIIEDKIWELFPVGARMTTEAYDNAIQDDKPEAENKNWHYWMRTPSRAAKNEVCFRDVYELYISTASPYDNGIGVRPALKLNANTVVSDEPDVDGYYEVLRFAEEVIEISSEDFFAILKM